MSRIEELRGRVKSISDAITGQVRTEKADPSLAGWGQFLEAASPVFQIGPYGTASGVVTNQIAFPTNVVDPRVTRQLWHFWEQQPEGKLFPQNVRLAFTVLALAKIHDPNLQALRKQITTVLLARQLSDGAWSDAPPHITSPAGGQPDATAWIVLALRRSDCDKGAMERGANWLAARTEHAGSEPLLSTIGLAAAIACHADPQSVPGLRARGFDVLARATISREELISFFDYEEKCGEEQVQRRDYLCYPAFYPLAVLAAALSNGSGPLEAIRLDAFRSSAVQRMIELSSGGTYKVPSARFSSIVDQAMYALACEELASLETSKVRGALARLYKWSTQSVILQLVIPLAAIFVIAAAIAYPVQAFEVIQPLFGPWGQSFHTFVAEQKGAIQVFVGLATTLLFATPRKGRQLLMDRVRGLRR